LNQSTGESPQLKSLLKTSSATPCDLTGTPIEALAGDGVIHHFRKHYSGTFILNTGIDREHGNRLVRDDARHLIAFGRDFIANPDLVERLSIKAPLNEQRPQGYYRSSHIGHTDYPI
jgi:N-ethylmaleimide reductase